MFSPTQNLLAGIKNAFLPQPMPWDEYFPEMAEADWLDGRYELTAVKSFFVRRMPFGGSFALLGGVAAMLREINDLRFDNQEFREQMLAKGYKSEFLDFLAKRKRLRVKVYSAHEGSTFFPNEPIVVIAGALGDIRLVEGIITEALNFPSLSLTKWNRLVRAVRPGRVLEFSRRRAQNHMKSALYAMCAGCFATSNAALGASFAVPVKGTMGHEWIQSYGDVAKAFDAWLRHKPHRPIGLVDTKQCLEHDFPLWLDAVWNHREAIKAANPAMWGWRNDSGDLAYLTIEQYIRFFKHKLAQDSWFVERMVIVLTNELDEYTATSIIAQIKTQAGAAGFDAEDIIKRIVWAAGTKPGTSEDSPSLGGVAKLAEVGNQACIKLALDASGQIGIKTSIPGFNLSASIFDETGKFVCELIYPHRRYVVQDEGKLFDRYNREVVEVVHAHHPDNPKLVTKVRNYRAVQKQHLLFDTIDGNGFTTLWTNPTISDVAELARKSVDALPWDVTRIDKPHVPMVSVTEDLFRLREHMIDGGRLQEEYPSSKSII